MPAASLGQRPRVKYLVQALKSCPTFINIRKRSSIDGILGNRDFPPSFPSFGKIFGEGRHVLCNLSTWKMIWNFRSRRKKWRSSKKIPRHIFTCNWVFRFSLLNEKFFLKICSEKRYWEFCEASERGFWKRYFGSRSRDFFLIETEL